MAAVEAPPHCESSAVERVKVSVRAQTFLDVLQGAFQSTWERPEVLTQAVLEVSATEEAKAGLRCLLSYLEALSPCVSRLCGVGRQEGEASAARQAKGRRKRRKRGRGGIAGGDVSEVRHNLSPEYLSPVGFGALCWSMCHTCLHCEQTYATCSIYLTHASDAGLYRQVWKRRR
jgi:hypothetical protein